jgi:hypothetical protein
MVVFLLKESPLFVISPRTSSKNDLLEQLRQSPLPGILLSLSYVVRTSFRFFLSTVKYNSNVTPILQELFACTPYHRTLYLLLMCVCTSHFFVYHSSLFLFILIYFLFSLLNGIGWYYTPTSIFLKYRPLSREELIYPVVKAAMRCPVPLTYFGIIIHICV